MICLKRASMRWSVEHASKVTLFQSHHTTTQGWLEITSRHGGTCETIYSLIENVIKSFHYLFFKHFVPIQCKISNKTHFDPHLNPKLYGIKMINGLKILQIGNNDSAVRTLFSAETELTEACGLKRSLPCEPILV